MMRLGSGFRSVGLSRVDSPPPCLAGGDAADGVGRAGGEVLGVKLDRRDCGRVGSQCFPSSMSVNSSPRFGGGIAMSETP